MKLNKIEGVRGKKKKRKEKERKDKKRKEKKRKKKTLKKALSSQSRTFLSLVYSEITL